MSVQPENAVALETLDLAREEILFDYRLGWESRQASLIGRREVMSGKAKFGIFGDGKELPQIALAKVFRAGDFRSGYYRDQTLMLATGSTDLRAHFAQLYAHADPEADPASSGRQMNSHFATEIVDRDGNWLPIGSTRNTSSDVSPTAAQMPRLVGLAYASRLYRELEDLHHLKQFSNNGSEIAFGTIGNASTSEGHFWEAVNAIGVLKSPAIISIWDDGYGISVPNEYQMVKQDIGALLQGFARKPGSSDGYDIYVVRGWDYPALVRAYRSAEENARSMHIPAIIHVTELTQPQGHSTSGSHERYKTEERLAWEREYDGLLQFRHWIVENGFASAETLDSIEEAAKEKVETARSEAWAAFLAPIKEEVATFCEMLDTLDVSQDHAHTLRQIKNSLLRKPNPTRSDIIIAAHQALEKLKDEAFDKKSPLVEWKNTLRSENDRRYGQHLLSETPAGSVHVREIPPRFSTKSPLMPGYLVMNAAFNEILGRDPRVIAFGEDVGGIGDVNQGFSGLQARYGKLRVSDTGIREATILGQAIGMAMRGLRPIAEIQYLDYVLYALQVMSDDLATLRWRTAGKQAAPVIIRTRGHRLEGIWHSGSPMAGLLNLVRGIHVCVPRNMVKAAGFYNTLLQGDDPGIVVEVLNGYRLKEKLPDNLGQVTTPLGVPEVLRTGSDLTLVTYGASCKIALSAADRLSRDEIDVEVIDVQSLLPFDLHGRIAESVRKTGRVVFLDEDVPGGTTAFMMQQVLENQQAFYSLDAAPRTITAKEHRPAYGSDGNYFSKPNEELVFESVYQLMHEIAPRQYPLYF